MVHSDGNAEGRGRGAGAEGSGADLRSEQRSRLEPDGLRRSIARPQALPPELRLNSQSLSRALGDQPPARRVHLLVRAQLREALHSSTSSNGPGDEASTSCPCGREAATSASRESGGPLWRRAWSPTRC